MVRHMLLLTVLLLCVAVCAANWSIFLLGDSVSHRIFHYGFAPLLNCTEADPTISFTAETSDGYKNDTGLICHGNGVTRIGYTIHFGVFESGYHWHWPGHKPHGASNNSRTNVLLALQEFQHRTEGTNDSVLFMFHSAAWDMLRYTQHTNLYKGREDWLDRYQDKYTTLMIEIRAKLRKQDQLVIATMHEMQPFDLRPLNERAKRVARHLQIPLFDQAKLLGPRKEYLVDGIHQNPAASMKIAENILANNFVLLPIQ